MMGSLKERLAALSPERQAELAQRSRQGKTLGAGTISRRPPDEPKLLSFAQQQLWFLDQLRPGDTSYNVPIYVRLRGELDIAALRQALCAIVDRHSVLRTQYPAVDGLPSPITQAAQAVDLQEHDLRQLPEPDRESAAQRLLKLDAAKPFDLARDLMLRCTLIRMADRVCFFLHNSHHIAWDLGSKAVFYRELEVLYAASLRGAPPELPALPIQYSDYAAWQRNWLRDEVMGSLVEYWKRQLQDAPTTLDLPTDRPRPRVRSLRGAKISASAAAGALNLARTLSARSGASLFMIMLSAFAVLLYSYTRQEEILIGSPVDGREWPEVQRLIGFFINTVVLRIRVRPSMTFQEAIAQTRDVVLGAMEHAHLPFHKVVEALRPPRDMSRSPLFQVNFRLQPAAPPAMRLPGMDVEGPFVVDNAAAKFDLALELPSSPDARGFWEFSTDLFEEATIRSMAERFALLLPALCERPDLTLGAHRLIGNQG